jgi:hypothetical protein
MKVFMGIWYRACQGSVGVEESDLKLGALHIFGNPSCGFKYPSRGYSLDLTSRTGNEPLSFEPNGIFSRYCLSHLRFSFQENELIEVPYNSTDLYRLL